MNKSQNENVFVTFFSHKLHVLDLLSSFYGPEWQIFLPCHILQQAKSLPLWYTKASKRYPFRGAGGAPRMSHYKENPLGPVTLIGQFEELETGSVLCRGASWDYFEDGACLPFTKSFRKIRLGSNYFKDFLGRSIKRKISRSNGTSEKVVLCFHTECPVRKNC